MRKPRVFLSHSKQDKNLIEKLANDLRRARIDVWYDEWEIPPGESFRKKIFEDGIPACDLFFIYLTENSKDSVWVTRELDAAFIHDLNRKSQSGFMAIFVSSDELRSTLPLDIQSLHSPVFNEEEYIPPLMNLISKTWERTSQLLILEESQKYALQIANLKNDLLEMENTFLKSNSKQLITDLNKIIEELNNLIYTKNGISLSLKDIFIELSSLLASGTNDGHFTHRISQMFNISGYSFDVYGYEFFGELILRGLLTREAVQGDETYILTETGKQLVLQLRN